MFRIKTGKVRAKKPTKPNSYQKKNLHTAFKQAESYAPDERRLKCTSRAEIINHTGAARHTGETRESSQRGRRGGIQPQIIVKPGNNSSCRMNFTNDSSKVGMRGHRKEIKKHKT